MNRFERQLAVPGWDQMRVSGTCVAVQGRGWTGLFGVWALACMGVGNIVWLGAPFPGTEAFARWFLADPCPFQGCRIWDYPFDADIGPELEWALSGQVPEVVLCCIEERAAQAQCYRITQRTGSRFLAASTSDGGWVGQSVAPGLAKTDQHPVTSMLVASTLADAVREHLVPQPGSNGWASGSLGLVTPTRVPDGSCVLVGVGGIGVYVATLAAATGCRVVLVDMDNVEPSNLNRQGLFTASDATEHRYKADAARGALSRLFPYATVTSLVHRVDAESAATLREMNPCVILSAVDNAAARLALSEIGRDFGVPVIQGGTDVFAADCFTQECGGVLLDEQMRGGLSAAANREVSRRVVGCAADPTYVVPGMIAGALMVHRMFQACELYRGLRPIHWRSGCLPVEQRSLLCDFNFHNIVA
jgi:hypothetical protein